MMEVIENWALHAYADGELQGEEKAKIEKLLAGDAEARRVLADIRAQKAELHKAYDGVLTENVPPQLLRAAKGVPVLKPPRNRWAMVAALGTMLIGGAVGWSIRGLDGGTAVAEALPQRALDAFTVYSPETKHPVEVLGADKDHLQMWLSKRIGVALSIPDLTPQGYTLVGGRLLPDGAKAAGLIMYEDAAKRRLVVYVAGNPSHTEEALKIEQHGPLVTCFWVEPDMVYSMAGPQSQAEMTTLAQALHEGFDKQG